MNVDYHALVGRLSTPIDEDCFTLLFGGTLNGYSFRHPRESGDPGFKQISCSLDSRLRGNDVYKTTYSILVSV